MYYVIKYGKICLIIIFKSMLPKPRYKWLSVGTIISRELKSFCINCLLFALTHSVHINQVINNIVFLLFLEDINVNIHGRTRDNMYALNLFTTNHNFSAHDWKLHVCRKFSNKFKSCLMTSLRVKILQLNSRKWYWDKWKLHFI